MLKLEGRIYASLMPTTPPLEHEDLKWIAATTTELNSVLQQISRYADLARRHKGQHNYVDLLDERVTLASKTAQSLFDRVTSRILETTTGGVATSSTSPASVPFTVLPSPVPVADASKAASTKKAANITAVIGKPATVAPPPPPSAASGLPEDIRVRNPQGPRELILFIEDEEEVADIAAEMLADEGYKVIVVHDGLKALKTYERVGKQIGLVILDFFLPILDGDAVFEELRAINPSVDVVLSSGFAEQSKISAMLAQGLRGFIPKPYTSDRLLSQVRTILDANNGRN